MRRFLAHLLLAVAWLTVHAQQSTVYPLIETGTHTAKVSNISMDADERFLFSASNDKTVRMWDLATGQLIHDLRGHAAEVRGVVFAPDGRTLVSGVSDGSVSVWDVATGEPRGQLRGDKANGDSVKVRALAYLPDGRLLSASHFDARRNPFHQPSRAASLLKHQAGPWRDEARAASRWPFGNR